MTVLCCNFRRFLEPNPPDFTRYHFKASMNLCHPQPSWWDITLDSLCWGILSLQGTAQLVVILAVGALNRSLSFTWFVYTPAIVYSRKRLWRVLVLVDSPPMLTDLRTFTSSTTSSPSSYRSFTLRAIWFFSLPLFSLAAHDPIFTSTIWLSYFCPQSIIS